MSGDWATRRLTRWSRPLRRVLWRLAYGAAVRLWCRPLQITGLDTPLRQRLAHGEPVVIAANHASHADTALLSLLLGLPSRGRLLPAAAEDHFFRRRWLGVLVAIAVGGLPFPRRGPVGLERCERALHDGDHVLLFPQGTREGGPFQPGIGRLASDGHAVLPVHISGTDTVLPKGRTWPRRAAVRIAVGRPLDLRGLDPLEATAAVAAAVAALASRHASGTDRRTAA